MSRLVFLIGIFFIFICLVVGLVVLQLFLSKRENKWLGLILPLCSLLLAITITLSMGAFTVITESTQYVEDEYGVVMEEIMGSHQQSESMTLAGVLPGIIMTFIMFNIPTLILLTIYWACRDQMKQGKSVDKMKIKDL